MPFIKSSQSSRSLSQPRGDSPPTTYPAIDAGVPAKTAHAHHIPILQALEVFLGLRCASHTRSPAIPQSRIPTVNVRDWMRHLDRCELCGPRRTRAVNFSSLRRGKIVSSSASLNQTSRQSGRGHFIGAPPDRRSLLKWTGNKSWLILYLERKWRRHGESCLADIFTGGLEVALGLCPRRAFRNDRNPHPVSLYGWIQKGLKTMDVGVGMSFHKGAIVQIYLRTGP